MNHSAQTYNICYEDLNCLTNTDNDILFIKTETGCIMHISVNNETFCSGGARLMFYWSKTPPPYSIKHKYTYICNVCKSWALKICKDSTYRPYITYAISLRCDAMVKVKGKGKGKKIKRCLNTAISTDESFCTVHNKCFLAYINKYISVSNDVAKLIRKLL
jgi:hypothetical protein